MIVIATNVIISSSILTGPKFNTTIDESIPFIQQQQQQQRRRQVVIPEFYDIVDKDTQQIIGNPQFLLDFAIIGNGKCGTTSLQSLLRTHSEVYLPKAEVLELSFGTEYMMIERLYKQYVKNIQSSSSSKTTSSSSSVRIFGYKNPGEIRLPNSIRFLHRYFPKTVLLIGIRHPVLWFESLYNFKLHNLPNNYASDFWGNPNTLIDKCRNYSDFNCVGTAKGFFHVFLSYLGKTTNLGLLRNDYHDLLQEGENVINTTNPIFLFEVGQLDDSNSTRLNQFKVDLQHMTGLYQPFRDGPIPHDSPGRKLIPHIEQIRANAKIRICQQEYDPVRRELVKLSKQISIWIRQSGFLDHADVHVSSKEYFTFILKTQWMKDPCS